MKKILLSIALLSIISCKENTRPSLINKIDDTLKLAAEQYKILGKQIKVGEYPQTYIKSENKLITSDSGWWCSGFYPGSLLYLYEELKDPELIKLAKLSLDDLKKEQFNTKTHDLGFMMYNSFGNLIRIEDKPEFNKILINSAKSLSTRYIENAKVIRSWDSHPFNGAKDDEVAVIIDNMMNLELLFWASEKTGNKEFYDIALNHANTTLENHFRKDNSSYHELIYKEANGDVRAKVTAQGAADESAWARGQAWGLYGFTVMYRITKNMNYLNQAQKIARFILDHPNLPQDKIPYWDFDAPNIPNEERDSSSAAIIASALIELSEYSSEKLNNIYLNNASIILENLIEKKYLAKKGESGGFILKHGVGSKPANSEVDVPLSYGDYYFIEAMIRYKKRI
jgi:unsaturated chondroitin disaccharide hydrolase